MATSRLPETAVVVVLEHHERFDGSGYPRRRRVGHLPGRAHGGGGRSLRRHHDFPSAPTARPCRPGPPSAWCSRPAGGFFDPGTGGRIHPHRRHLPGGQPGPPGNCGHLAVVEELHADARFRRWCASSTTGAAPVRGARRRRPNTTSMATITARSCGPKNFSDWV